jgi:predicted TIM-barrel enzyme
MGFSGVNNFPTVGVIDGKFRQTLEETDLGYYHEVETIRISRALDMFTIVYCFNEEEASQMAEAGADVIIAHVGTTVGGSIGATDSVMSLEQAAETVQKILAAARTVSPDIIGLSHGGPIATPEDAAYINVHTDAVGFVGASSIERMATEDSIRKLTEEFKSIPLGQYQI